MQKLDRIEVNEVNYIVHAIRTAMSLRLEGRKSLITLPVVPVNNSENYDNCINTIIRRVY